jgi:hypothetical protein
MLTAKVLQKIAESMVNDFVVEINVTTGGFQCHFLHLLLPQQSPASV